MRPSRGCHDEDVIFHFNGGLFSVLLFRSLVYLSRRPLIPLIPFICFVPSPGRGSSTVWPLYSRSRSGPLHFPPVPSLFLSQAAAASSSARSRRGSTASFYLGANVLIACGRSSRPFRFPPFPSVSSSSRVATPQPPRPPKSR